MCLLGNGAGGRRYGYIGIICLVCALGKSGKFGLRLMVESLGRYEKMHRIFVGL